MVIHIIKTAMTETSSDDFNFAYKNLLEES